MKRIWSLMFSAAGPEDGRSSFEQFAIPHMFQPKLSMVDAAVAVMGTLARMLLGCLLFAVWGAYSFEACQAIHPPVARVLAAIALAAGFLAAFACLMIAINASVIKLRVRKLRS